MLDISISTINELVSMCKNCGQCNLTCPSHLVGLFNPLGVIRDLQMNPHTPEIAISNHPIFNCLTCNRCMTYCPAYKDDYGMNMALLIRELRKYAVEHEIQIKNKPGLSGKYSLLQKDYNPKSIQKSLPRVNVLQYFKNRPELKVSKSGDIAYFIDDIPQMQISFENYGDDFDQIPQAVVKILNQLGIKPVVLNMKACGHDDLWVGNFAIFKSLAEFNIKAYKKAKVKTIIIENDEIYRTWKYDYPKIVPDFDFEVYHLSEFLLVNDLFRKFTLNHPIDVTFTYHDSSRLGRLGGELYDAPRIILESLPEVKIIEMENNRNFAYDYGCTPFLQINESTEQMWLQFINEIRDTGARYFITTSPKTIAHYRYVLSTIIKDEDQAQYPIVKDWAVFLNRFLR